MRETEGIEEEEEEVGREREEITKRGGREEKRGGVDSKVGQRARGIFVLFVCFGGVPYGMVWYGIVSVVYWFLCGH